MVLTSLYKRLLPFLLYAEKSVIFCTEAQIYSVVTLFFLNKSEIHQSPAINTIMYIMRAKTAVWPPQIQATISNLNKPMLPQFTAPIIVKIKAILSIIIIFNSFTQSIFSEKNKYMQIKLLHKNAPPAITLADRANSIKFKNQGFIVSGSTSL